MTNPKIKLRTRPVVLIIRDGWGQNPDPALDKYNALKLAKTPVDDMLMRDWPHTLIATSGEDVGLPEGTMGNSEVGHQNIGAGRIVYQESMRLTKEIRDGAFFTNPVLLQAIKNCQAKNSQLHLLGLCSDIGVHSLLGHLYALLELCRRNNFDRVYLHAFTDGRDSPPNSGLEYLRQIEARMKEIGAGKIASVMGRFYGMDRDQRWDRVEKAYRCLRSGVGNKATSAITAIQESYAKEISDEFIEPTLIVDQKNVPLAVVQDGDSMIHFNFRGDRPREITRAFVDPEFKGFDRGPKPDVYYVCLTEYDKTIPAPVAFPKPPKMKNTAGQYWSDLGLTQFRCAETEKYAHVTFFFNDYTEPPFPGEDRQIVSSPKVRTYDEKPEMSAPEVCDVVCARLDSNAYDMIIVNFANPDMVGHTGFMDAAIKAAETVDQCVGRILEKLDKLGGSAIITADHGNLELMWDLENNLPFTSHTTFPVPLIVYDKGFKKCKLRTGCLADILPTALQLQGIPQPAEMTGKSLIL